MTIGAKPGQNQAAPTLTGQEETPVQRASRLRKESLAAAKKKAAAAGSLAGELEVAKREGLAGLEAQTASGSAAIRRAGAKQLSATLGGAPRTGAGARLAAARSIGQRGLTAQSDFEAEQVGREAALRAGAAKDIAAAGQAGATARLEALGFEKELASEQEDATARAASALSSINSKLSNFEGFFNDDEEGAATMIANEALQFKDQDPVLYQKMLDLSAKVKRGDVSIGSGTIFGINQLG
jgi:hypothetical protein